MDCSESSELLPGYIYDTLPTEKRKSVESHLEICPRCREELQKQKKSFSLLDCWEDTEPHSSLASATISAITEKKPSLISLLMPRLRPALGLLVAAYLIVMGTMHFLYLFLPMDDQKTLFNAPPEIFPESQASFRIVVQTISNERPVKDARVKVELKSITTGNKIELFNGKTDIRGTVEPKIKIPALAEGRYSLIVSTRSRKGGNTIETPVSLERYCRILLSTDRPVYQPCQTIHMRSIAISESQRKAIESGTAVFEVEDPKGNKVFRKKAEIGAFGIASCDFTLAREISTGSYRIRAETGKDRAERVVEVKRYVLPKFKIDFEPSRKVYRPGDIVTGTVRGTYFFGRSVRNGVISIDLSIFDTAFHKISHLQGRTNDEGLFRLSMPLPSYFTGQPLEKGRAVLKCDISLKDSSGHQEKMSEILHVAETAGEESSVKSDRKHHITIDCIPEKKRFIPGISQKISVITTLPDGASPLLCDVTLSSPSGVLRSSSDRFGISEFTTTPQGRTCELKIEARKGQQYYGVSKIKLSACAELNDLLLRTDRAIYTVGGTLKATVLSPDSEGTVYIDVMRNNQTLLTRALALTMGRGEMTFDLTDDCTGTLMLNAYRLRGGSLECPSGVTARDTRTITVLPSKDLNVSARADRKSYQPGDKAHISYQVRDERGEPVPAAIGVNIVDESVFSLVDDHPGLEKIYFAIESDLMAPKVDVCAHNSSLNMGEIAKASGQDSSAQRAAQVLFTAVPHDQKFSILSSLNETLIRYDMAKENYRQIAGNMLKGLLIVLIAWFIVYASKFLRAEEDDLSPASDDSENRGINLKILFLSLAIALVEVFLTIPYIHNTPFFENIPGYFSIEFLVYSVISFCLYSWLLLPVLTLAPVLRRNAGLRLIYFIALCCVLLTVYMKGLLNQALANDSQFLRTAVPLITWINIVICAAAILTSLTESLAKRFNLTAGIIISCLLSLTPLMHCAQTPVESACPWPAVIFAGTAALFFMPCRLNPLGDMKKMYGYFFIGLLFTGIFLAVPCYIIINLLTNNAPHPGVFISAAIQILLCAFFTIRSFKSRSLGKLLKCGSFLSIGLIICAVFTYMTYMTVTVIERQLMACRANEKSIGTALEMYSSDNQGRYPRSLSALTPGYLQSIPKCPSANTITYCYTQTEVPDCYTVWCAGGYHFTMEFPHVPEYDAVQGLYEDGGGSGAHDMEGLAAQRAQAPAQYVRAPEPRKMQNSPSAAKDIRVRQLFPETLYWNPLVITDKEGKAELDVPMADSITTWRMMATASTMEGIIGSATTPLSVFQDFFIEPDLPEHLTRGDEITLPVTVYNYLPRSQNITVTLKKADWFDITGPISSSIRLGASDVGSVPFTIRVKKVGDFRFKVEGRSKERGDSVSKPIRVDPEGRETVVTWNGRLNKKVSCEIRIPPDSVSDGSTVLVKVYPAMMAQIVGGLEGMLKTPHG